MPIGYESPRQPLTKKMFFGDSAPTQDSPGRACRLRHRVRLLGANQGNDDASEAVCGARPRAAVVSRSRPDLTSRSIWRVL